MTLRNLGDDHGEIFKEFDVWKNVLIRASNLKLKNKIKYFIIVSKALL